MLSEFKTILCPTDFSVASYHAIDYAARFARASGGTLIIAHLLHDPMSSDFRPEGYALPFADAKKRALAKLEEACAEHAGGYARCELVVEIGDPYSEISALLEKRRVDLLVMSTRGRTGLPHLIIGSVAEKLIRHAACPIFLLRKGIS